MACPRVRPEGALLSSVPTGPAAAALVGSLTGYPSGWKAWLPTFLGQAPRPVAEDALRFMAERDRKSTRLNSSHSS